MVDRDVGTAPVRPLRVVAFGNSVSVLRIPWGTRPPDDCFPLVIPVHLADAGIDAVARNEGRVHDFVHTGLARYERDLRPHAPDVVVLHYGVLEAQPWFGPLAFLRHVISQGWALSRTARWYRRVVVKAVWDALAWYRERVVPRVGRWTWQVSPRRFEHGMRQLVRLCRDDLGSLVLVLGIAPTPSLLERRVPGQGERAARYNRVLADVVAGFDSPDVVLVPVDDLVEDLGGPDAQLPDGLHFTPELHRAVAGRLAQEVRRRFPRGSASLAEVPERGRVPA